MTPRASSLILHAMGTPESAAALADLAVLLLAESGDVTLALLLAARIRARGER